MQKKPRITKAIREEVRGYIEKWRTKLFLHEWYFDVSYPDSGHQNENDGSTLLASIAVNQTYSQAHINVFPSWISESNKKKREEVIVHELCHCLTESVYSKAFDLLNGKLVLGADLNEEREKLTQKISTIAFRDEW